MQTHDGRTVEAMNPHPFWSEFGCHEEKVLARRSTAGSDDGGDLDIVAPGLGTCIAVDDRRCHGVDFLIAMVEKREQ